MNKQLSTALYGKLLLGLAALAGVIFTAYGVLCLCTEWIESVYAVRIYPVIYSVVSTVSGVFPFSLAEALIYLIAVVVVLTLVLLVIRCKKRGSVAARVLRYVFAWGCFALVCFVLYAGWGLLYHRETVANRLGLTVEETSKEELADLCRDLMEEANRYRALCTEDAEGNLVLTMEEEELFDMIPGLYERLSEVLPCAAEYSWSDPKPVLASSYMDWSKILGIYIPVTAEANLNVKVLPMTLACSACHEIAHQRGYAREDEANYIAYRACILSDDPYICYSGYYTALLYSMNALAGVDKEMFNELCGSYSEAVHEDYARDRAFWKAFDGPVAEVSDKVNDKYLKSNAQSDGVQSYGRMVDLLIAERRAKNGNE